MHRRTVLGSALTGALAGAASAVRPAATQEGAGDPADHPLVGTWAVLTPGGVVPQIHGADGSVVCAFPPNYVDPVLGLTFQGPGLGRWEATGERRGRFTFLQALADAEGTYLGTFQLEDDLEAGEDGQTWSGSTSARLVSRDAGNNVTFDQVVPFDPPVTAVRVGASIDALVLPVASPAAGTPTS